MKYDVFISYRREGGYDTAKHLNDLLIRDGYRVSFDIDTLRNGDFDTQLLTRIEGCKDFILIVDKHAFDRTLDKNFDPKKDWLRRELAHALKHKKNIIPVFLSGMTTFPEGLPEDVANVVSKHGPKYDREYFNEFYNTLKNRFLKSKPYKTVIFIPTIIITIIIIAAILFSLPRHTNQLTVKLPTLNISQDDWGENVDANGIKRYCSIGFYEIPMVSLNNGAIAGPDHALLFPIIANESSKSIRDLYVDVDIVYDAYMEKCFSDSSFWINTAEYNITSRTENILSLSYKNDIMHPHMRLPLPVSSFPLFLGDRIGVAGGKVTFYYTITYDGAKEPIQFEYIAKMYYRDGGFSDDFIGNASYEFLDEIVYSNFFNPRKLLYEDGEWIIIYRNNIYRDLKHLSNEEFKILDNLNFSNLQN